MTHSIDESRPGAAEASALGPLTLQEVEEFLTLLGKSVRAHQMYQANNPVYQRFVEGMRLAFIALWDRVSALVLDVEERGLIWNGKTVLPVESREDFSRHFYKDGVRRFTFLPGFEEELERFLGVVHRARQAMADEDDLVTLLWAQDFDCFRYSYIDLLAEGLEVPDGPPAEASPVSAELIAEDAAEAESEAAPAQDKFSREHFRETLYFLDEDELVRLQAEVDAEWSRDLRSAVLNALFDRLEDPNPARQDEILGILRQLLPIFLSRGELRPAASVLRELDAIQERAGVLGPAQHDAIERLFDELSEPESLGQLVQALEDGAIHPDSEDLSLFLSHLRPSALPQLVQVLERAATTTVRERLRGAVDRLASQHPERVVAMLESADPVAAAGAARIVGRLRQVRAASSLMALLEHAEPSCRLAAVEALVALRSAGALESLQDALEDPAREVRIAAARGLGLLRYPPARARLERVIDSRALRNADLTEKLAFFEAYALVAGAEAVPVLDRLLNGRGMLRRRLPAELRACAATALGRVAAPAARAVLRQASEHAEPIVRSAVLRALRREVPAS